MAKSTLAIIEGFDCIQGNKLSYSPQRWFHSILLKLFLFQIPPTGFVHQALTARHATFTCSPSKFSLPQLRISPNELDFGMVKQGSTCQACLTLTNVGINSCQFKIRQLEPTNGVKVHYMAGQVTTVHYIIRIISMNVRACQQLIFTWKRLTV